MGLFLIYFAIQRGRPRKSPGEATPVSPPGDATCNQTSTKRRKRLLSKHSVDCENNNNDTIEPASHEDDVNGTTEERVEEKGELSVKEESMIDLGGDDAERKLTYAGVEKTEKGWVCTICGKVASAKHNLLGEYYVTVHD